MDQGTLTDSLLHMDLESSKKKSSVVQLPGSTTDSLKATLELLKKNDLNFNIFVNEQSLHNHCVHHLLAAYAFGASPEQLKKIYEHHALTQLPRLPPKETITQDNWTEFLG